MADIASITDEQKRCRRSDGRGWRCRLQAAEGRAYCQNHLKQGALRQRKLPVPESLKLKRAPPRKSEHNSDARLTNVHPKRPKKVDSDVPTSDDQPEISPPPLQAGDSLEIKVGVHTSSGVPRPFRSKNAQPHPIVTIKKLPNIKENLKTSAIKKCHWCRLTSYCVFVKCLTCKKHFFCEECISKSSYTKKEIKKACPVCHGECSCQACSRGKPEQVEAKLVTHDLEENVIHCDPEKEMTISDSEGKFDLDKSQHVHMIRELLPVMTKMNEEKIIELEAEAKNKGISHAELQVQIAKNPQKKECSFCKACIPDAHRSCGYCSFIVCISCCHEIRDGRFHSNLEKSRIIRSKCSRNTSWKVCLDGGIKCPPKNLGGCEGGLLQLTSFCPFNLTKDLEEKAKQIVSNLKFKKPDGSSNSSSCLLCDENDDSGLYFSTKQEFKDKNLEHFMKHWGNGQPVVIRDVFQSLPDLNWDFGFMLCEYLEKSFESRNGSGNRSQESYGDWCTIKFGRKQIFSGGLTHENVWNEFLEFKLGFSSYFLEDHFPDHYDVVIKSFPVKEYMNPFTGFMNLGAYTPYQRKVPSLGSYVSISYGGFDNPMNVDPLSNLRIHAYDVVNVLAHASSRPISGRVLNEVKMAMSKYNSQDHLNYSRKIANRNKLEGLFASSGSLFASSGSLDDDNDTQNREVVVVSEESESESESDDEDSGDVSESESDDEDSGDVNSCGAHWDVFRREDVQMLLEYLKKYSDKLNRSHGSPQKVVHPLFDEVFYLDDDHKTRLEEEFNVTALSFKQNIGEAVIIPAGCPYQIKNIKSCVNVVYEFMSPESAMEGMKMSDEVRLLPVNHKAKGNMVPVKEMVIDRLRASIEEMSEMFVSQTE